MNYNVNQRITTKITFRENKTDDLERMDSGEFLGTTW